MTTINQIETIRTAIKGIVDKIEVLCSDEAEEYDVGSVKTAALITLFHDDFKNHGFNNASLIERKMEIMLLSRSYYSKSESNDLLTLLDRVTAKIKNIIPDKYSTPIQIESRRILRKKDDIFRATIAITYKCDQFN